MIAEALLARRLGDQLLEPGAEVEDLRRRHDGELVAARLRGEPQDQAEHHAGVVDAGPGGGTTAAMASASVDEAAQVDAHHRRRHQAERATAPRSVRRSAGCPRNTRAEPVRLGHLLHLRAGVGDGDEVLPGAVARRRACVTRSKKYCLKTFGSSVLPDLLATMTSVCVEVDPRLQAGHLRGVGGVEHVQVGRAVDVAEGEADDLRAPGSTRPCRAAARA